MVFYVLIQPEEDASVELVEHIEGKPSLIVEFGEAQIAFQSVGRIDGPTLAARFARDLAAAAQRFAERCERQSYLPPLDIAKLTEQVLSQKPIPPSDSDGSTDSE